MNIASFIEHTNLTPTLTASDIDRLVQEAVEWGFLGVCVPPFWVERAKREISGRNIVLVTVAGFPLGYSMTETKVAEIERALDNGADEVDMVWNISSFRSGLPWTKIEIARCSKLVHDRKKLLKIIIETAYLSDEEIRTASKLCADAGADFVKTSTGFASAGAMEHHVRIMKAAVPEHVGIKASGGIKTLDTALAMIDAGASRIGTSSGIAISTTSKK